MMKIKVIIIACIIIVLQLNKLYAEKVKIAIGNVEYKAVDSSENKRYSAYGKGAREDTRAFVDMLTTALVKTRKFDLIERDRMFEILKEQGLSIEGIASGGYNSNALNIKGVDYIITGAITEYSNIEKSVRVEGFTTSNRLATMVVDIRILDVHSGSIVIAEAVKSQIKDNVALKVQGYQSGRQNSDGSLLGSVMRKTSQEVSNLIVGAIYPVKIVAVIESVSEVMLSYGNGFLNKGDILDVFNQGEKITDPDTGEILGTIEEHVGKIKVISAQSKFSKAIILEGSGFKEGMIARINSQRNTESISGNKNQLINY